MQIEQPKPEAFSKIDGKEVVRVMHISIPEPDDKDKPSWRVLLEDGSQVNVEIGKEKGKK